MLYSPEPDSSEIQSWRVTVDFHLSMQPVVNCLQIASTDKGTNQPA